MRSLFRGFFTSENATLLLVRGTWNGFTGGWKTGRRAIRRKYISLDPLCDVNWRMESCILKQSTYYSIAGKRNFVSKLIKWWSGRNLFSKIILFYFKLTHGLSLYREKKREKRENLNWNSIKKKKERSEKVGVVNFFIYKLADKSIECSRVIKVKNKNFPFKYRNTLTPSSFPSFLFSSRINNFWIFKILHELRRIMNDFISNSFHFVSNSFAPSFLYDMPNRGRFIRVL